MRERGVVLEQLKDILAKKFEEIVKRATLVIEQLSDEEVNWRPNESSNSIANLVIHIEGNIYERIGKGMNKKDFNRNRDAEFEIITKTKSELIESLENSFGELIATTKGMTNTLMAQVQTVRNIERTNLDVLIQCATHFSEHVGQMMYICKMIKNHDYVSTTIPKKK